MRVVDLFCGAGGFSEGFYQCGFEIICGIDKWDAAVKTHQENHKLCKTINGDIEEISKLPDQEFSLIIPDSEVIIGSPPCVDFSNSNKSGKSDKSLGIRLIEAFLRIIARKQHKKNSILKYWILENVPNTESYIQPVYSANDLGVISDFDLLVKGSSSNVYNAQDFGSPSKRLRYICGSFPQPSVTNNPDEYITMNKILDHLGNPEDKEERIVIDPNYNFSMMASEMTDHFYIQELAEFQWKQAKRLKQDKGYMGKMAFPEDISKSSRTIMATMSFSARESMIFPYGDKYRAPTIREIASLMSFPIDYRFYGDSISSKYRLIGNAVPPKLSIALAKAIGEAEGLVLPLGYEKKDFSRSRYEHANLNFKVFSIAEEKPKRHIARYKYHIPYLKINTYRVVLTNHHSNFSMGEFVWSIEIHKGQGPYARILTPSLEEIPLITAEKIVLEKYVEKLSLGLSNIQQLQSIYIMTMELRHAKKLLGPDEILDKVKLIVDNYQQPFNEDAQITIDEVTYTIPRKIAFGYVLLKKLFQKMEDLSWKNR